MSRFVRVSPQPDREIHASVELCVKCGVVGADVGLDTHSLIPYFPGTNCEAVRPFIKSECSKLHVG